MKVLITGCQGFIGSHLADRLIADGNYVWGVDNGTTGRPANFPHGPDRPEARFKYMNIGHQPLLLHYAEECKPDLVIHCAASYKDPGAWHVDSVTNVLGTIEAVSVAKRNDCPLIYFQTSLCYGSKLPINGSWDTADLVNPESSYAISKTAAEQYIRMSGLDYVSFRLANIYGPRNLSGPIPTFYKKLSLFEQCTISDTRRDFVFIDDLVGLVVKWIQDDRMETSGIYHVSTGRDYDIYELYVEVETAMGIDHRTPEMVARGTDDVETLRLENWKTIEDFNWMPTTGLTEGIQKAVDWYQENGVGETFTHLAMKT